MNSIRRSAVICVLAILSVICTSITAQNLNTSNLTSSPYTRYGYGRLGSLGNSVTRSMGDVGIAVRTNQFTTLANPASLTAIDTLTMIFTCDLDAQFGNFSENGVSNEKWDAGFSGMSFHAPLWRNFAMSLSLTPYSEVGYYYGGSEKMPVMNPVNPKDTLQYSKTHLGVGGVNNFMFGLGWKAFSSKMQELSIGVNAGWLFGSIEHGGSLSTSQQANSTILAYDMTIRGLYLKFGAQYTKRLNALHSVTVGSTFSPKLNLSIDTDVQKYSSDTITYNDRFRNDVKLPMQFGVGLSYNYNRQLMVSAEYEFTQWSKVNGLDTDIQLQSEVFNDTHRIAVGVEYRPKLLTNNFFKACRYRLGFNTKQDYIKVNGKTMNQMGATIGMSMPVNKRSFIDLGIGYATIQPEDKSMLKENYLTFNIGVTFNEMMFFRNMLR